MCSTKRYSLPLRRCSTDWSNIVVKPHLYSLAPARLPSSCFMAVTNSDCWNCKLQKKNKTWKLSLFVCFFHSFPTEQKAIIIPCTRISANTHDSPGDELGSNVVTVISTIDCLFSNKSSRKFARPSSQKAHSGWKWREKTALNPAAGAGIYC